LLVYTDGVTEAFNGKGEMFEEARLVEAVAATASEPAGKIIERIKSKLLEFRGQSAQGDDVAMIAVKIL
jgi:sigma-B regulation protein RsbU (phosphoserine phosphatase)